MKRKKLTLKATVLSLGLAVGMMLPTSASAQGVFGDMLDNYYAEKEQTSHGGGALLRGSGDRSGGSTLGNEAFGATGSQIDNEPFGVPIGGGIGILLAAGMGYAFIQSKKNKQN